MAERTGMGEGYPRRLPVRRGVHGNGIPHMERQSGSDRDSDSAQPYGGTGHQFGNKPGDGGGETLPSWYHRAIVISAVIGFAVLILIAKMHGG